MAKRRKRKSKRKRKPQRKAKRYHGKTEKEWRDWGEKFGKRMDKRGKDFAEEMEDFGKRFGIHMEQKGRRWERECRDWWFRTLGFVGPLVGSIFGIICVALGIFVLNLINLPVGSNFISQVSNFLFSNIHWFFAIFLFFGYSDYFSKRYSKTYWMVSPIFSSIGAVIVIWISIWVLNLINAYANSSFIASLSDFLAVNLWGIFIVLLILGYALAFIKKMIISSIVGFK